MKINQLGSAAPVGAAKPGRQRATPAGTPPAAAAGQTDVQLSRSAGLLQSLEAQAGAAPEVDTARVEAIRQAIAAGRLKMNPEGVADGLLRSVRDLLGRG